MSIALVAKHTSSRKSKSFVSYNKIDATSKWIEYSLDQIDLKAALKTASFEDKCRILQALAVVERKLEYHYKHKNFCMSTATAQFKLARRLLKM